MHVCLLPLLLLLFLLPSLSPLAQDHSLYTGSFSILLISTALSHLWASLLQLLPPPGMFPLTSAPVKMLAILLDSAQIPASHSPTLSRLESTAPSSDLSDHMTYLFP